ncbi:MAG: class I SAM-dependent methyltransferase [Nocardioidaceae bacterium]
MNATDYDAEAPHYDETRGGQARAESAAHAIGSMLPSSRALVIADIAGGTGIVAAALATQGRRVVVLDLSTGMLQQAARRLPGYQVRATALALPMRDASVDVVTCIWFLHLLERHDDLVTVVGEVARVLKPGGRFVTTVDKDAACGTTRDRPPTDHRERVEAACQDSGLRYVGSTEFVGHGQRSESSDPVYVLSAFSRGYR